MWPIPLRRNTCRWGRENRPPSPTRFYELHECPGLPACSDCRCRILRTSCWIVYICAQPMGHKRRSHRGEAAPLSLFEVCLVRLRELRDTGAGIANCHPESPSETESRTQSILPRPLLRRCVRRFPGIRPSGNEEETGTDCLERQVIGESGRFDRARCR